MSLDPEQQQETDDQPAHPQRSALGTLNVVLAEGGESWRLLATRKSVNAIMAAYQKLAGKHDTKNMRVCDSEGIEMLIHRTSTGFQLVPDCDMFDDKPPERIRL